MLLTFATSTGATTLIAAAVGVGTGVVTTVAGAIAQRWNATKQISFQRGETDRQELREILDKLAEQLFILCEQAQRLSSVVRDDVLQVYETEPAASMMYLSWEAESLAAFVPALKEAQEKAVQLIERLRLRPGPDGEDLAAEAMSAVSHAYDLARLDVEDMLVADETVTYFEREAKATADHRDAFLSGALQFTKAQLYES